MRKAILIVCLVALLAGCTPSVPSKPSSRASSSSVSVEATETKDVVFERIGRFTYPVDYVTTGGDGNYKLRDSMYYSVYLTNKVVSPANNIDEFAEYTGRIAKVSLREYERVYSEDLELDGCKAFYIEGHGKDSNKYKYIVFLGILTENGMTIANAVISQEDWDVKGPICREILRSFKNEGMVPVETLRHIAVSEDLNPSLEIPFDWVSKVDSGETKVFTNASGTVELTVFFGSQDHASLDSIVASNNVDWDIKSRYKQGFEVREATGKYIPVDTMLNMSSSLELSSTSGDFEEEDSGALEYYVLEATENGYRCIIAMVTKSDLVTSDELLERESLLGSIKLYEDAVAESISQAENIVDTEPKEESSPDEASSNGDFLDDQSSKLDSFVPDSGSKPTGFVPDAPESGKTSSSSTSSSQSASSQVENNQSKDNQKSSTSQVSNSKTSSNSQGNLIKWD